MGQGKSLGAKLFLEGKEVPFIGASITHTVNQASIAYIDLVPQAEILNIKPRTLVQLFVRNYMDPAAGQAGAAAYPFVLAWEGEVFGYNFSKSATARTFSISCIDYSSYWDNVLTYFFNPQQSLGQGAKALSSIGLEIRDAQSLGMEVVSVAQARESFFRQKLEQVLKPGGVEDKSKDFLDGFVELIKDFTKVNDFYESVNERLRINDRILLHSSKSLHALLEKGEALSWFSGLVGRTTGYSSLRMVIQDLMSLIFHDAVSVPFPAAVRSTVSPALPDVSNVKKTIGNFVFKPNLYMMPPPMCNVFFPDEYSQIQFSRNFFQEPTRLIYAPELPTRLGNGAIAMPHMYEPESFSNFMLPNKDEGTAYEGLTGRGGIEVNPNAYPGLDIGYFMGEDKSPAAETNNAKKRAGQFLTNEERMKGIWMARESMMPATTQFQQALSDYDHKNTFAKGVAKYLFYKKRFQSRQLQITSHLKLSVVPGFPVLLMDDSDTDQTVVAYCSSVTHRIYATEGGYTNVTLSYARTVAEQDSSTEAGASMLIPPWFNETVFGKMGVPPKSEAAPEEVAALGKTHISTPALSEFYAALLGDRGSEALTAKFPEEVTLVGAVRRLQKEYRQMREKGNSHVDAFVARTTSRDYVKMKAAFEFIGATTLTKDVENEVFNEFTGNKFTRRDKRDADAITLRRNVITKYRDILKTRRSFRG